MSNKIFCEVDKEKLNVHLEKILPANSALLNKESYFVKEYLGYCSIGNDLEFVKLSIEKLIEIRLSDHVKIKQTENYKDENFLLKRSLYISSLINYSRCFSSGNGRLALNKKIIKKNFPQDILNYGNTIQFHIKLMDLRNKYVAHEDLYHLNEIIGFIEFEFIDNILESRMNYAYAGIYSFDEDELENFLILTSLILKNIEEKKKIISKKIIEEITDVGLIKIGIDAVNKSKLKKG